MLRQGQHEPSGEGLAVEATNLVKDFNETRAVDGVSLKVPTGSIYGLLGPNGAGKSTLMRFLATLQQPTSGSVRFDGIDVLTEPQRRERRA